MAAPSSRAGEAQGIATLDLNHDSRFNSSELELYFDMVHISAEGHRLAAEAIGPRLEQIGR